MDVFDELKKVYDLIKSGRYIDDMSTKSYTVSKDEITFNDQPITDVISSNEDTGEIHYYERHWSSGELVEDGSDPTGYRTCKDKGKVKVVKKYAEPTTPYKDPSTDYPGYSGGYGDPYMGGCFPGSHNNPLAGPVFDGFLYADYMPIKDIRRSRDGKEIEVPVKEFISIGLNRHLDYDACDLFGMKRFIRSSEWYVSDITTEGIDLKGRWEIYAAWQKNFTKDSYEVERPIYLRLTGQGAYPNVNLVIYAADVKGFIRTNPLFTDEVWARGELIVDYIENAVKD